MKRRLAVWGILSILFLFVFWYPSNVSCKQPETTKNTPPTLEKPSYFPEEGKKDTVFKFMVIYSDADNDPPIISKIYIDGKAFDMQEADKEDQNYIDGKEYLFSAALSAGNHVFYLKFSDGKETVVTEEIKGPKVIEEKALFADEKNENHKPICTLLEPRNGETVYLNDILVWMGYDIDGDKLTYNLCLDTSPYFADPLVVENLTKTSYTLENLTTGKTYFWKVVPFDGKEEGISQPDPFWMFKLDERKQLNKLPIPKIRFYPEKPMVGEAITFDGSASEDPDGQITNYLWVFSDGSSGPGKNITHAFQQGRKTYTVMLIVTDDKGGVQQSTINIYVGTSLLYEFENRLISILASATGPAIAALIVTLAGVAWATRRRRRFHRLERRVLSLYHDERDSPENLKSGLNELKKEIRREFADGKIDKVHFDSLTDLINGYLKELVY